MTGEVVTSGTLSVEDAVRLLRRDPAYETLVRDAYIDEDVLAAGERFFTSSEFRSVLQLLGGAAEKVVLDLGAGNGVATYAFARAGAREVIAVEPDASDEIGRGAILRLTTGLPVVRVVDGLGDALPAATGSIDLLYARQVLHHIPDLATAMAECYRVLRPGGTFIACREHVVDNPDQLEAFLAAHPVHKFTGSENAYQLAEYVDAITRAGFALGSVLGPIDSVINAFPSLRTQDAVDRLPLAALRAKLGPLKALARLALWVPGVRPFIRRRLDRPTPGRLYSFVATKP